MGKYIPNSAYISKDPEKRANQLKNLKHGYKKSLAVRAAKSPCDDPFHPMDIITYLQRHFYLQETKKPVVLEDWQKEKIFKPLFKVDDRTGLRKHTLGL